MYLADMITKQDKKAKVDYILSTVLKIKKEETTNDKSRDKSEVAEFLSEQMIKEVKKAFKK